MHWIPKWFTVIVISRDLIVVIGCFLLYMITNSIKIEPVFLGKLAIALQLFILAYVLLNINISTLPPVHNKVLCFQQLLRRCQDSSTSTKDLN